jgi:predicted HicB family RNase H-like nuclease
VPETKNLLLRLDPALAEQLAAVAEVEGKSVSDVVREAVRDLVSARRVDKEFQKRLRSTARRYQRVLNQLRDDER